jgi:hypothetical protein
MEIFVGNLTLSLDIFTHMKPDSCYLILFDRSCFLVGDTSSQNILRRAIGIRIRVDFDLAISRSALLSSFGVGAVITSEGLPLYHNALT